METVTEARASPVDLRQEFARQCALLEGGLDSRENTWELCFAKFRQKSVQKVTMRKMCRPDLPKAHLKAKAE